MHSDCMIGGWNMDDFHRIWTMVPLQIHYHCVGDCGSPRRIVLPYFFGLAMKSAALR